MEEWCDHIARGRTGQRKNTVSILVFFFVLFLIFFFSMKQWLKESRRIKGEQLRPIHWSTCAVLFAFCIKKAKINNQTRQQQTF